MMDRIHDDRAFTQQNDHTLNDRALVATSGNKQLHAFDNQEFMKNERHYGRRHQNNHGDSALALTNPYGATRFPVPRSILGSNDRGAALRQTLAHRRLWQRLNAPRPYLSHPAYVKYRNRPRKDTDKSGEVIWTDEVEEAFQNAMVCIPPMGKKKRSQNGKPHGRNELVSEWIFHETGFKLRQRKQVSSHLQVLDKYLNEVPEWQAVRKELNTNTNTKSNNDSASDHYFNSVEEVVREVQRMKADPLYRPENFDDEQLFRSNETPTRRPRLREVDFGMWVSLPNKMDDPLHRYTTLRNCLPGHIYAPLDSISNWQSSFPGLESIVQKMSPVEDFDIIFLDVKLRLMDDFPPESSKLGISLGLDFTTPGIHSSQNYENLRSWICTTHMYQSGRIVRSAEGKHCPISGSRMIKPPFESKWWAFEFTRLTDERRRAQDDGDQAAISAVEDSAREYLQNLSVMQQIFTIQDHSVDQGRLWPDGDSEQKRMAILLWKFSAARSGEIGTTTWQRVVLPVIPVVTDCMLPTLPTGLPLTMLHDTSQDMHNSMYDVSHGYEYVVAQADNPYPPASDDELCHDGFMMITQQGAYNTIDSSLSHVSNSMDCTSSNFNIVHDFGSIETSQHLIEYGHLQQEGADSQIALLDHYFNHEDHSGRHEEPASQPEISQSSFETRHDQETQSSHQPLHRFDISTHKLLQEQLGSFQEERRPDVTDLESIISTQAIHLHQSGTHKVDEEALKEALIAASAVETPELHKQSTCPTSRLDEPDIITSQASILSPIAIRPPFRHHHSFAGVSPAGSNCTFDLPRNDVAQLFARMEASRECMSTVVEPITKGLGHELMRAQSQPELSTEKSDGYDVAVNECTHGEYIMVAHQDLRES